MTDHEPPGQHERYRDFNLESLVELSALLEQVFETRFAPNVSPDERDIEEILQALHGFCGYEFYVRYADLNMADDQVPRNQLADNVNDEDVVPQDVFSICVMRENINRKVCSIYVNSWEDADGPLVNQCWERFCIIKEACHAVLRYYFTRSGWVYPDNATVSDTISSLDNIIRYRFSLRDFDADYPISAKLENAAELLAVFLLYPLNSMTTDRTKLRAHLGDVYMKIHDYYDLAVKYRLPKRFVAVFLNEDELEEYHNKFKNYIGSL